MNERFLKPPRPLLILAFAVFGVTIAFPFIALDDAKHIWQNPYVMSFSLQNLKHFWSGPYYGLFVPFVYNAWSVLALITQGLGLKNEFTVIAAPLFHAANVALHLLNIYLAWILALQIFHRLYPAAGDENSKRAFVALIPFAIHPLQVETVVWASGLKDVLAATPTLLALIAATAFLPQPTLGKRNKHPGPSPTIPAFLKKRPALAFNIFAAIAMLCKPSSVVLPPALIVMAFVIDRSAWRRVARAAAPALALAIWVTLATKGSQPDARLEFELAVSQRPLVALGSLGFYILKFMAPWPLSPDYGLTPPKLLSSGAIALYWGAALAFLALTAHAVFRKWRKTTLAGGWVVLGLLPVLGLVPFEFQNLSTVADRYVYLFPSLGMGLLFASLVDRLPLMKYRYVMPAGLVIIWTALSFLQALNWQSNDHLFRHTANVNPASYLALNNLGLQDLRRKDFDSAEKHFKSALTAKPDYLAALANLGVAYFKRQDFAAAISHYTESLKKFPEAGAGSPATFADMHFNLGASYLNTGRNDQGLSHLQKAVLINPDHFLANFHLGRVLAARGDKEGAKRAFGQALRLQPNDPMVMAEVDKL
jgi:tetratricopeptide (TPR) repeat protein